MCVTLFLSNRTADCLSTQLPRNSCSLMNVAQSRVTANGNSNLIKIDFRRSSLCWLNANKTTSKCKIVKFQMFADWGVTEIETAGRMNRRPGSQPSFKFNFILNLRLPAAALEISSCNNRASGRIKSASRQWPVTQSAYYFS